MELTLNKEDLSKALHYVQSVSERKSTMPILNNILFIADEEGASLIASDLELTSISKFKANVITPGKTTLNGRLFGDIVRELPGGEVMIKLQPSERVEFHSQVSDSTLKLVGHTALEYPNIDASMLDLRTSLSAKQFLDMINKTLYAISQDETRVNINGACLSSIETNEGEVLQLVATDGHRLAKIIRPISGLKIEKEITIPKKGLLEIKKLIEGEKADELKVGIHASTNKDGQEVYSFVVADNSSQISIRLIDAPFPDYQQVFPSDKGQSLIISKEKLEQALKRVSLVISDKNKSIKVDVIDDVLQISGFSHEVGEAQEQLTVEVLGEKQNLTVGFNARFMLDFTNSLHEEQEVVFEIHGTEGPAKLYPRNDESYVAIVMPMRLS